MRNYQTKKAADQQVALGKICFQVRVFSSPFSHTQKYLEQ